MSLSTSKTLLSTFPSTFADLRNGGSEAAIRCQGRDHALVFPNESSWIRCGYKTNCERKYDFHSVVSIQHQVPTEASRRVQTNLLTLRHRQAQEKCLQRHAGTSGGFCYTAPVRPTDSLPDRSRNVQLSNGRSYFLPKEHFPADPNIVQALHVLLAPRKPSGRYLSVNDLGAGVGQYGHSLLALDKRHRWRGYDAAGNVESVTGGFVQFFDLTIPLWHKLPRANWVLSLETLEHIPNRDEINAVRNMHALNCDGVILSSGILGQPGIGHRNNHDSAYWMDLWTGLGYTYDSALTYGFRAGFCNSSQRHASGDFFAHLSSNLLVFRRDKPLRSADCY